MLLLQSSLHHAFALANSSRVVQHRCVVVAARKQQSKDKRKSSKKSKRELDIEEYADQIEGLTIPAAPPPSVNPVTPEDGPEQIYPVFAPKPGDAAPWRWADDDGPAKPKEPEPETLTWNPYTGFTRIEPEAPAGTQQPQQQVPSSTTASPQVGADSSAVQQRQSLQRDATATASTSGQIDLKPVLPPDALPYVGKGQILSSALGTGFWMTLLALFMRNYAQMGASRALGTDPQTLKVLLEWPDGLGGPLNILIVIGTVVMVTGARLQLLNVWPEFKAATDRSNRQVLAPLGWLDIAVVALASGIPEELLFRGAVIPATFPDWRGVLLSAAIFGALHNNGGRNLAFSAWAGAVGAVYGGAYLVTQNVWVPAAAHVLANFASAAVWKINSESNEAQQQ